MHNNYCYYQRRIRHQSIQGTRNHTDIAHSNKDDRILFYVKPSPPIQIKRFQTSGNINIFKTPLGLKISQQHPVISQGLLPCNCDQGVIVAEETSQKERLVAEVLYTAVGFAVLTFQRGMVAKNEIRRGLNRYLGDLTTTIEHLTNSSREK